MGTAYGRNDREGLTRTKEESDKDVKETSRKQRQKFS